MTSINTYIGQLYEEHKKHYEELTKISYIQNPLVGVQVDESTPQCEIQTSKKTHLYTFRYDPEPYITLLSSREVLNLERFDNVPNNNCCKVIAIALYFTKCDFDNMEKYIFSIYRTVKNVKRNLPDFIVRIYLDMSVYECINKIDDFIEEMVDNATISNNKYYKKFNGDINFLVDSFVPESKEFKLLDKIIKEDITNVKNTFKYIIESDNVEVYTITCTDSKHNVNSLRTLRFMPIYDPEVALYVIREADGTVSNLDCNNIKIYDTSKDKLFYQLSFDLDKKEDVPLLFSYNEETKTYTTSAYSAYSVWLQIYKLYIANSWFDTHHNIIDICAGLFSCKLRLTKTFYDSTINMLLRQINNLVSSFRTATEQKQPLPLPQNIFESERKFRRTRTLNNRLISYSDIPRKIESNIVKHNYLYIGLDEILLLDIFKDIISLEVEKSIDTTTNEYLYTVSLEQYKYCESIFCGFNNRIFTFDVSLHSIKPNETNVSYIKDILSGIYNTFVEEKIIYNFKYKWNLLPGFHNIDSMYNDLLDIFFKNILYFIDGVFLKYIVSDEIIQCRIRYMHNRKAKSYGEFLWLLNTPYLLTYESYYV